MTLNPSHTNHDKEQSERGAWLYFQWIRRPCRERNC